MIASELKLYELIKEKLGKETAEAFIDVMDAKVNNKATETAKHLATKEDLHQTKVDLIKWVFAFFVTLALMIIGLYLKK